MSDPLLFTIGLQIFHLFDEVGGDWFPTLKILKLGGQWSGIKKTRHR